MSNRERKHLHEEEGEVEEEENEVEEVEDDEEEQQQQQNSTRRRTDSSSSDDEEDDESSSSSDEEEDDGVRYTLVHAPDGGESTCISRKQVQMPAAAPLTLSRVLRLPPLLLALSRSLSDPQVSTDPCKCQTSKYMCWSGKACVKNCPCRMANLYCNSKCNCRRLEATSSGHITCATVPHRHCHQRPDELTTHKPSNRAARGRQSDEQRARKNAKQREKRQRARASTSRRSSSKRDAGAGGAAAAASHQQAEKEESR
jgi:hypothetical protein